MKLFKGKPKWLRPEIDEGLYWVHLGIILLVVYTLMNWKNPGNNYLLWVIYLAAGDVISHTILGLD